MKRITLAEVRKWEPDIEVPKDFWEQNSYLFEDNGD